MDSIKSIYANQANCSASPFDFQMVFNFKGAINKEIVDLDQPVIITMSPQHTKAFLGMLVECIKKYEDNFGEIKSNFEQKNANVDEV